MPRFSWQELLLILVIIVIVFGVSKLPQVGASLGKGIREFRRAQRGDDDKEGEEIAAVPAKSGNKPE
ncbi:MAG: twin-arginine translocase TatA/TatE family subunit [Chloroflexota bacterium]